MFKNFLNEARKGGSLALKIAPYVIAIASVIAAVTPTPADDSAVAVMRKIVDILALNVGNSAQNEDD